MKNSVILNWHVFAGIKVNAMFDADKVFTGIFIPVAEKEKLLNPSTAKALYNYMSKLDYIPFYESSFEEIQLRVSPVIEQVHKDLLEKGLYLSYKNELCTAPNLMIHEYQDRKELVSVDVKTGAITTRQVYQK